ncbi:MAG: hypothetical protein DRI75_06805 [Bacteroidetes bacterium]|nr:MAG: hypothetical protein DRI75_06805 [Bacteroidota bacterium]
MKRKTKLLIKDAFLSTILSCFLLFILAFTFINVRFFNPLHKAFADFSFLDVYYAYELYDTPQINTDIILVNIENKNRFEIAQLLQAVIDGQPKTIGFDIILEEQKEPLFVDSMLTRLLNHEHVITSFDILKDGVIFNHTSFGKTEKSAFINFNFDDNTSVIREFIGNTEVEGENRLSFAVQIAKHYMGENWQTYNYDKKLNTIQTIKYSGNYKAFQYLDSDDFLDYEKKTILKNKIVILGYLGDPTGNTEDIQDKFFTPLNKIIAGKSDADMFGIVIHANIINMLINGDMLYKVSNLWLGIFTFLAMFFSTMFYLKINKKYKISYRTRKQIFQFVISIFILTLSLWLYKHNIVLKPVIIIIGIIIAGSYFKYYKHLIRYIKTKRKWKSYL